MSRHSSTPYATPLRLEPRRSVQLAAGLLVVYTSALILLPWLPLPEPLQLALGIVLTAHFAWLWCHELLRVTPWAVHACTWLAERDCRLRLANGSMLDATLLTPAFVQPWLVIISVRSGRWQRRHLLLLPDMLDAATLRRLRVRLRTELD